MIEEKLLEEVKAGLRAEKMIVIDEHFPPPYSTSNKHLDAWYLVFRETEVAGLIRLIKQFNLTTFAHFEIRHVDWDLYGIRFNAC